MKPTLSNAFVNHDGVDEIGGKGVQGVAPLCADLSQADFGWSLQMAPMHAADAVDAWMNRNAASGNSFLLFGEQSDWTDHGAEIGLNDVAQRLDIPSINCFDDQMVMDHHALRQLVSMCRSTRLLMIEIEGPVEAADIEAINRALEAGSSPLDAELRAVCALEVIDNRSVTLHARSKTHALAMLAENFRHYLAAVRSHPSDHFAAPELFQLERLLDTTGLISVRPIETEIFSTSIDVGISTARQTVTQPANRSLIYDIPSNTWHDEM